MTSPDIRSYLTRRWRSGVRGTTPLCLGQCISFVIFWLRETSSLFRSDAMLGRAVLEYCRILCLRLNVCAWLVVEKSPPWGYEWRQISTKGCENLRQIVLSYDRCNNVASLFPWWRLMNSIDSGFCGTYSGTVRFLRICNFVLSSEVQNVKDMSRYALLICVDQRFLFVLFCCSYIVPTYIYSNLNRYWFE